MKEMKIAPIGTIEATDDGMYVVLDKPYVSALKGLEGFSHVNVLWWFDGCDTKDDRRTLVAPVPYGSMKEEMGAFATRSPRRPNPVALTTAQVLHVDYEAGRILVSYIDADNMSPVIDLKPYTPSLDRVESPSVPQWCAHWPASLEESATFDWEKEFDSE